MKIELAVESEHYVDLDGISELIGTAWTNRENVIEGSGERERVMFKTEDGYWRSVVKLKTK